MCSKWLTFRTKKLKFWIKKNLKLLLHFFKKRTTIPKKKKKKRVSSAIHKILKFKLLFTSIMDV